MENEWHIGCVTSTVIDPRLLFSPFSLNVSGYSNSSESVSISQKLLTKYFFSRM